MEPRHPCAAHLELDLHGVLAAGAALVERISNTIVPAPRGTSSNCRPAHFPRYIAPFAAASYNNCARRGPCCPLTRSRTMKRILPACLLLGITRSIS